MERIKLQINVDEISKDRLEQVSYYSKQKNAQVMFKQLNLELVPLKQEQVKWEDKGRQLVKTHFISEALTQDERASGKKGNIIGDGLVWRTDETQKKFDSIEGSDEIDPDGIPF